MAALRQWSPEMVRESAKNAQFIPIGSERESVEMLEQCCVSLCSAIASKLQENVLSVPQATTLTQPSAQFSTKSTVGLMLSGAMIDNMVVGGPAYNSGQLQQGDIIVQIDGKPVTVDELHAALLGSDVPGTTVAITVKGKSSGTEMQSQPRAPAQRNPLWFAAHGPVSMPAVLRDEPEKAPVIKTVILTRMATEVIADRRRIFELFTIMKVQAQVKNDTSAVSTVDECIQLWNKMLLADSITSEKIAENVKCLQRECMQMLEILMSYIECLARSKTSPDEQRTKDRSPFPDERVTQERVRERASVPESPKVGPQSQQDSEGERVKQLMEKMNTTLDGMIAKEQHDAEIARLQKQISSMVPKPQYDAAQDEIERCQLEIQRLKKSVEGMVHKAQHQSVQDEISVLTTEISRLQKLLDNSVPKTQFVAAQEELRRSCAILQRTEQEIQRLKKGMEASTPKVEVDTIQDELLRTLQEVKNLQERINGMVPKSDFTNLQVELEAATIDNARLQKMIESMVSRTQFDLVQDEVERNALEIRRLKRCVEDMVPKEELRAAQDEVSRYCSEIDIFHERLKNMVPKEQLTKAEVEMQGLNARITRMQNLIDEKIPRDQFDAANDKIQRAEKEIERLHKTIEQMSSESQSDVVALRAEVAKLQKTNDGMITKVQYDAAKDETQLLQLEMDRLKKCIDSMVPKAQLDTAMDEVSRCLDEIQRLQERMKNMIPKDDLVRSEGETQRLEADLSRMKQYLDTMVPQAQYEALEERMEAHNRAHQAEIEGMKKLLDTMVSRAEAEADLSRLQKIIDSKVPKAKYDALMDENHGYKLQIERLQSSIQGMIPKTIYESLHDEVSRNSRELERLQKSLADSVPKADFQQVKEDIKRLTIDSDGLKVSLAMRTEQVSALQNELKTYKENLEKVNDTLLESVPRREMLEARAEAKAIRIECDTWKQEVSALQNQVASLTKLLEGRIAKEELVQAESDAKRARDELVDFKQRLTEAGLADAAVLNRLLSALKSSPATDPNLAAKLLEKLKGTALQILIDELCQLIDLLADPASGVINVGEINTLISDLRAQPSRNIQDARSLLRICNQPIPISPAELKRIRTIVSGPPAIGLDQLELLLIECPSVEVVQSMRLEMQTLDKKRTDLLSKVSTLESKIIDLESQNTELERQHLIASSLNSDLKSEIVALKVPPPPVFTLPCKKVFSGSILFQLVSTNKEATIYYTVDGTDPDASNFFGSGFSPLEVLLTQSCVVKAVCISGSQASSSISSHEVVSEKDRMERSRSSLDKERGGRDRPVRERSVPSYDSAASSASTATSNASTGGLGMLIQRFHDDGHVEVKSLIEGGAASRDGRISPGDRLLAVDHHDTTSLSKGEVLQLIAGPVGTQVELKLMRTMPGGPPEVFWVTLVRSATNIQNLDTRSGPSSSRPHQSPAHKDPSLAFILGRHI